MLREEWERALTRAVVERSFRARLLTDPADTLVDYGLDAGERAQVEGIGAPLLEQLAARLLSLATDEWSLAAFELP